MGISILIVVLWAWSGPSSGPVQAVGTSGALVLNSFAAYEGLAIRKALAIPVYRNQALGIGLVAIGFVLVGVSLIAQGPFLPPNSTGPFGTPISLPFLLFAELVFFYWIDASIRAGRHSDPLLRDTLSWRKVRIVAWAVTLVLIAMPSSATFYLVIATGLSPFAQPNLPPFLSFTFPASFFIFVAFGAIYLPLTARRSKDSTLRRHLSWFAFFVIVTLGTSFLFPLGLPPAAYIGDLGGGYLIYRSARSLVPLHRISFEESMNTASLTKGESV